MCNGKTTVETLQSAGINGASQQGKNTFRIPYGERGVVIYHPKDGKWQHRGRVYTGTINQLASWLQCS